MIKIEAGKFYRTRDGHRMGPVIPRAGDKYYPWGLHPYTYTEDGRYLLDTDTCADLVAEWTDEDSAPAQAEADIKATIADEAKRIVSGARRSAYGKPEANFERIARFWQAYFENTGRGDVKITARDVSPLMRLMKEARLAESPEHYDSFVDLAGYTLTGAEVNGVKKPA